MAGGKFGDQQVAKEGSIVAETPQLAGGMGEAFLVMRVEAGGHQRIGTLAKADRLVVGDVENARHQASSAS